MNLKIIANDVDIYIEGISDNFAPWQLTSEVIIPILDKIGYAVQPVGMNPLLDEALNKAIQEARHT